MEEIFHQIFSFFWNTGYHISHAISCSLLIPCFTWSDGNCYSRSDLYLEKTKANTDVKPLHLLFIVHKITELLFIANISQGGNLGW